MFSIHSEPPAHLNGITGAVLDSALEVHRALGPGFLESLYESALCVELRLRGIPFERQFRLETLYKGEVVGEHRFDLLVAEEVVVELKAVESIAPIHMAQALSYLKAGCFQLGLIINFNVPLLKNGVRRVVWSG